jgi:putative hydrolase of the HAD superfamily
MIRPLPRALFFDAAGTLITVAEPVGVSYSRIAAEYGLLVSPEAVMAGFKKAWKETPDPLHPMGCPPLDDDRSWWQLIVQRTFTHAMGCEPESSVLAEVFTPLYEYFAQPQAWQLYPDVLPVLQELHGQMSMLVLSNFDSRLLALLDHFGLSAFFVDCILSSKVGAAKPHERMFQAALERVNMPAELCYHVGDEPVADSEGAARLGIPSWLVSRPDNDLWAMLKQWK